MKCSHCEKHQPGEYTKLEYIKEVDPYTDAHLWCEKCNSTFTIGEEYKQSVRKEVLGFIGKRTSGMYYVPVMVSSYYEYFDKSFIDEIVADMVAEGQIEEEEGELTYPIKRALASKTDKEIAVLAAMYF